VELVRLECDEFCLFEDEILTAYVELRTNWMLSPYLTLSEPLPLTV